MELVISCLLLGNMNIRFWNLVILFSGAYYFQLCTTRRLAGNRFFFFVIHIWDLELRYGWFLLELCNPNFNETDEFSGYLFPTVNGKSL
jgi:hypothetical protein